ncbi:unnamed protein product [Effrenium voratum]|nr:unnamed protein product [Effrenium voratum]
MKRFRSLTPEKELPPWKRPKAHATPACAEIVGLTGFMGAGKGSCAEFLVQRGYRHEVIRDYLGTLVAERGLPAGRDEMLQVANELREKHGPAVLVERLCAKAKKSGQRSIIDSVRTVAEAEAIRAAGGMLLAVEADSKTRFSRVRARRSSTDSISWQKFLADDEREMQSEDPTKPSLSAVIQQSDKHVENNGSLQDLHTKLREIFPRPPWLCIIGPHGTGKTHMLSHVHDILKQRSIQVEVVEELARGLITEMGLKQEDFTHFTPPVVQFQMTLLKRYLEKHKAVASTCCPMLSDRSTFDQLAYLDWQAAKGQVPRTVVEEAWSLLDLQELKELYEKTSFLLLMPDPTLCKNDGTRMQSSQQDLEALFQAFRRVLQRAGVSYRECSARKEEPSKVAELFI